MNNSPLQNDDSISIHEFEAVARRLLNMAVPPEDVAPRDPLQSPAASLFLDVSESLGVPSEVLLMGESSENHGGANAKASLVRQSRPVAHLKWRRAASWVVPLLLVAASAGLGWFELLQNRDFSKRAGTVYSVRVSPKRTSSVDEAIDDQFELQIDEPTAGTAYVVAIRGGKPVLLPGSLKLPGRNRYLIDIETAVSEYYLIIIDVAPEVSKDIIEEKLNELKITTSWSDALTELLQSFTPRQFACTKLSIERAHP